jgi:hypothetical protein
MRRAIIWGIGLWVAGTVGIRFGGYRLLRADDVLATAALFALSFLAMAVLIPRICRGVRIAGGSPVEAATLIMLPTLVLDPLSSAFFGRVFPNADPRTAGVFGGWMLISCAGAVVGVWLARWRREPAT